jgi:hypothetical protein
MDRRIMWLRISYWVGAVLDGLWVIPMLLPEIGLAIYGIKSMEITGGLRYTLAVGAALMAGWTCLLIWADRKPVERRGVLLLTIVPVIAGLRLSEIYLFVYGYVTVADMIPSWIMGVLTLALFIFSYVNSASLVRTAGKRV